MDTGIYDHVISVSGELFSVQKFTRHFATFESLKLTLRVSSIIPGTTSFNISSLLKTRPHGNVQANKKFLSCVLSL